MRIAGVLAPRRVAHAHSGTHSYVTLHVGPGDLTGNVQFPATALDAALATSIPPDEAGAMTWLEANRDLFTGYVSDHLTIDDGWRLVFGSHRVLARPAYTYLIVDLGVEVPTGVVPRTFTVSYDGIIHADPGHEALVIIKTSAGIGPMRTVTERRIETRAGATKHRITMSEPSPVHDAIGAAEHVARQAKGLFRRVKKRLQS